MVLEFWQRQGAKSSAVWNQNDGRPGLDYRLYVCTHCTTLWQGHLIVQYNTRKLYVTKQVNNCLAEFFATYGLRQYKNGRVQSLRSSVQQYTCSSTGYQSALAQQRSCVPFDKYYSTVTVLKWHSTPSKKQSVNNEFALWI